MPRHCVRRTGALRTGHYGTRFHTPVPALWGVIPGAVPAAQGAQAAGPRLVHVACTLAKKVTRDIEALSRNGALQQIAGLALQPILHLQQRAAGEGCKWLIGYCDFLLGRYGGGGDEGE